MAANKTRQTTAGVKDYIDSRASDAQKADCATLMALFKKLTKHEPVMWGPSIIGYGRCQYTYASGRSGEMPVAAFAIRGKQLCIYLDCEQPAQRALLGKLGEHSHGKSCLYIRRLADIDQRVLEELITASINNLPNTH
jgi:hypothetical protein